MHNSIKPPSTCYLPPAQVPVNSAHQEMYLLSAPIIHITALLHLTMVQVKQKAKIKKLTPDDLAKDVESTVIQFMPYMSYTFKTLNEPEAWNASSSKSSIPM